MLNKQLFAVGELKLYEMRPPLCGYHVIAVEESLWAMRAQYIDEDGNLVPPEPDDPVSTNFYGVAGEGLDVDRTRKLPGSADGRTIARALASIGYTLY